MSGNSATAVAIGGITFYRVEVEERSADAGLAMRVCTFFHTNAATANRMILRMINSPSEVGGVALGGLNNNLSPSQLNRRSKDSAKQPSTAQPHVGQRRDAQAPVTSYQSAAATPEC